MANSPRTYTIEREFPLPRERVWELLGNTDHLNRVIGLFAVKASAAEKGEGGFSRELAARVMGLVTLRWRELPFRWRRKEMYSVERRYVGGPMLKFVGGVRLSDGKAAPAGSSTFVHLFAEFTPRNIVGVIAIPIVGRRSMVNTMKYLSNYLSRNKARVDFILPQPRRGYSVNRSELDRLLQKLSGMPVLKEVETHFRDHVMLSGDDEVVEMNPYLLADRWKLDRTEVLRWFLHATTVGITNLTWRLICPNCRVAKVETTTLSKVTERFHCDFCGIDYGANFDRSVELTFSIQPLLREAVKSVYCVGGPMLTPHIYIQEIAERGATTKVSVPSGVAVYRMRVLQLNHAVRVRKSGGVAGDTGPASRSASVQDRARLVYRDAGWTQDTLDIDPSLDAIEVANESSRDVVIACERADWAKDAVTAATVTTMEEFRRMFSSEVLAPGQQIGVENVTLMFTDLLGSTSFYEAAGDARAYGQVRRHFGYLTEWISRNNGSVVKTIGDAVMATFQTPTEGLTAALEIQSHVDEFNAASKPEDRIVIKIGLHHGPAIAVNSNDRLDYFGRTVNIAARIQGLSEGGDIVVSDELAEGEGTAELITRWKAKTEKFRSNLKGIEGAAGLIRILPE